MRLVVLIILSFIIQTLSGQVSNTEYKFLFSQIDNQALIIVNDSTVFDSGKFDYNPEISLGINISEFLIPGSNEITVRLINYNETDCYKNPWAISYEFFMDADPIDYQSESSDGIRDCGGIKFEHTYYINK